MAVVSYIWVLNLEVGGLLYLSFRESGPGINRHFYRRLKERPSLKSQQITNARDGAEKREPSCLYCLWECELVQPQRRTVWSFLNQQGYRMTQQSQSWEISSLERNMHLNVHNIIYNSQDMEAAHVPINRKLA